MKWTDTQRIAEELSNIYPNIDPLSVRFTDLHQWVTSMSDFDDNPDGSTENILEAILSAWIDEVED